MIDMMKVLALCALMVLTGFGLVWVGAQMVMP